MIPRLLVGLAGTIVCFRGYSTFKIALALTSFLVGAHLALIRFDLLPVSPEWLAPALVVAAGLVASTLVLAIYRLGVMLLGAGVFVQLVLQVPHLLPHEPNARLLVLIGVAALGAILSRFLERIVLSTATAVYGAFMISSAIFASRPEYLLVRSLRELMGDQRFLLVWAVLTAAGIWSQHGVAKKA